MGAGIGVAGLMTARAIVRNLRRFSWDQKRVLVTGGSRGLGLVIARQLASKGVRLAICARTPEQLKRAVDELRTSGGDVIGIECDVRDPDSVKNMFAQVEHAYGNVEVLFNVAGVIEVGPFDSMTMDDFENSMQTNCWGTLRTIQAALPGMRVQGWGRIMNIASLGGQRAVPHMLPYAASKFATVGMSNGLRAELKHENILVGTACPGLIRTGSPRNAMFKGKHRKEYAWFSIGDSLPLMSMSAEEAASQIIEACQQGRGEFIVASPLNLVIHMQRYFPTLTQEILALMDQLLPEAGGIGTEAVRGYESQSKWSPSELTVLNEQAAKANNEI